MKIDFLQRKSIQYRRTILRMIKHANAGHTGGSLSCIDILNVLYNHTMNVSPENFDSPDRDRFIQSKGHSVEALYAVLADKGFYDEGELETLEQYQSKFIGHPTRKVRGIEQNTGALGHGLSISVGIALAAKLDGRSYRTYTLLGDGEMAEGSNWEAMMSAAQYQLENLVIIIDHNSLQITGRTKDVMSLEPLEEKLRSFGLAVRSVPGHDLKALINVFDQAPFEKGKPSAVIANTIKGHGISFIADNVAWHHHVPSDEEYQRAMQELDHAEKELVLVNG